MLGHVQTFIYYSNNTVHIQTIGGKMARIKPRGRYMAISVPIDLHDEITDFVKKTSYNSIADFVKDAVRSKMNEHKLLVANNKLREDLAKKHPKTQFLQTKMVPVNHNEITITEDRLRQIIREELKNKNGNGNGVHGLD